MPNGIKSGFRFQNILFTSLVTRMHGWTNGQPKNIMPLPASIGGGIQTKIAIKCRCKFKAPFPHKIHAFFAVRPTYSNKTKL